MSRNQGTKDLVLKFIDEIESKGNLAKVDEFLSENFVNHGAPRRFPPNAAGFKDFLGAMFKSFPDLKTTVHHVIAEDNKVTVHKTQSGTHQKSFMLIPATGRKVNFTSVDIFEVQGEKIQSHWHVFDFFSHLAQMGVFEKVPSSTSAAMMSVPVEDLERSKAFYEAMLNPLGYEVMTVRDSGGPKNSPTIGFGIPGEHRRPHFWIYSGELGEHKNHLAFRCSSHEQVDACFAAGVSAGGKDNGGPGRRSFMPPYYYGAFILDPDGNEIEPLCWS